MILDEAQVKALALAETDDWIKTARKDSKKLKMHFFGDKKDQFLTKIEGLENDVQLQLRKDHAPSNKHLVENMLRPFDNVWSAKGGLVKLTMKSDELQERFNQQIKNVKNGKDAHQYLKDIWSNFFFTDPSGLLFMELSSDGDEAYLTQKSIFDIKNMKVAGIQPEYVVFEVDEIITEDDGIKTNESEKQRKAKAEKMKKMWIIDDAFYYRVQVKGKEATIIESRTVANSFEKVPGIVNSSVFDTNRKMAVSPVWKQVELLDNYLVNNSVKEIHQFLHGYPIFWMYSRRCEACNGKKEIYHPPEDSSQEDGTWKDCMTCNGTGRSKKKDVSDGIDLAPPKDANSPTIDEPAGYVEPGIDTWKQQRTELDWKWNQLFFSHWGTTVERGGKGETATGRFIDAQPVNNRLNDYSDAVEVVHKWVLVMFAKFIAENSVDSVVVNYGRRYLIETPDQIWEKYIKAKNDNAPETALNLLLIQYYESEFQHNEVMREYYLKLMLVEPYVHKTVEQVMNLPVDEQEKKTKLYFQEWANQTMISEVISTTVENLKKSLRTFADTKQLVFTNGNSEQEEGGENS